MRGWRPFGKESELQVIDDPVYNRMVFDKSDDRHPATAFWTEEGVYLINFTDHLRPAFGGHIRLLFINDGGMGRINFCLDYEL